MRKAKKLFRFLRTVPVPANTSEILALERTKLANERTLLSYIRSALYLFIGGIGVLQLDMSGSAHWLGYLAIFICILFLTIGFIRYTLLRRRLEKWNRILFVKAEEIQQNSDEEKPENQEEF